MRRCPRQLLGLRRGRRPRAAAARPPRRQVTVAPKDDFKSMDWSLRLLALRWELSVLFGFMSGTLVLMWYVVMYQSDVLMDGLHRLALTRSMGFGPLFLSDKVLRANPSHRVYSLLHQPSGDAFVYAVHFASGEVYSARLARGTRGGDRIRAGRMVEHPVDQYVRKQAETVYWTPQRGLGGALSAWYSHACDVMGDALYHFREQQELVAHQGDLHFQSRIMIPFGEVVGAAFGLACESVAWALLWAPRQVATTLWGTSADAIVYAPVPVDGNPTLDGWKDAVEKASRTVWRRGHGLPFASEEQLAAEPQLKLPEPGAPDGAAVWRCPAEADGTAATLRLLRDDWASGHLQHVYRVNVFLAFTALAVPQAALFARRWRMRCAKPNNQHYIYLSHSPGTASVSHGISLALVTLPVSLYTGAHLVGHAYATEAEPYLPGPIALFVWNCTAMVIAWRFTAWHAMRRVLPTELAIRPPQAAGVAAPGWRRAPHARGAKWGPPTGSNMEDADRVELGEFDNKGEIEKNQDRVLEVNLHGEEWRREVRAALLARQQQQLAAKQPPADLDAEAGGADGALGEGAAASGALEGRAKAQGDGEQEEEEVGRSPKGRAGAREALGSA
eukprot:TRINITY_DN60734_c0_g1_i1.p1 TRINITY_DN60734_c0_g1~~TRINITY_DN60734_c0_g1_i1.p1  ORF type:complete len:616 (+),score=158.00 TRINITY_DN60734_c0_g1_i1:73-1920(+)